MKNTLLLSALIALSTAFAMPLKWTCNFPEASAVTFSIYQGETVTFEPTFRVNGVETPLQIANIYYQTNGMADAWWKLDGSTFAPTNDVGAKAYRFFIQAAGEGGKNYRANGTLRMLPSPGFVPNSVAAAERIIDSENFAEAVKAVELPVDESLVAELAEYSGINLPTAGVTSIGFLLIVLIGTVAALTNKKADKTALDNLNPTARNNSQNQTTFVTSIARDNTGKLRYDTGTIPTTKSAASYTQGIAYLYGTSILDYESDPDYLQMTGLLGWDFGNGYHTTGGAVSGRSLAMVGTGITQWKYCDRYMNEIQLNPFCHHLVDISYSPPNSLHFLFDWRWPYDDYIGGSWQLTVSKRCTITIDARDLRSYIPIYFGCDGYIRGFGGVNLGESSYGWREITPGVVNRFEIVETNHYIFVKKYEFEMESLGDTSSSWGSGYDSSWGSSDWGSSDWGSDYSNWS